jgi:hypothetical protein
MSYELEVLRLEYLHARNKPLFDKPEDYCYLLDLIISRIEELEREERD